MKDRYFWLWGAAAVLLLGGSALGQAPCTRMNLTTQEAYTLPVLPPVLQETLTFDVTSETASVPPMFLQLWVRVLQNSHHPNDTLTVSMPGLSTPRQVFPPDPASTDPPADPNNTGWQPVFISLDSVPAALPVSLLIQASTRTDVPGFNPTVYLIGAAQLTDTTDPGVGPTLPDILGAAEYSSNIVTTDFEIPGVLEAPNGIFSGLTWPATQAHVARLGGLTMPRFAVSWYHDGKVDASVPEHIQLYYGAHAVSAQLVLAGAEGEGEGEGEGEVEITCKRESQFIPPHLLGTPQRPILQIEIDPARSGSRLIVDNFTLTYLSQLLEVEFWDQLNQDNLEDMGNIVENGGFEKGAFPFVIESPLGQTNCVRINDVVRENYPDACDGEDAAVFERPIVGTPYVAYCVSDELIGRGQTGTLTLSGMNLEGILQVLLVPELYRNDDYALGNFIVLERSGGITLVQGLEQATYTFQFDGPFNPGAGGNLICTDGRAIFRYTSEGQERETMDAGTCSVLIDTVPPVLLINEIVDTDAANDISPSVRDANRTPAGHAVLFPGWWVPALPPAVSPRNNASYTREDMQVYLNAGTVNDVPYEAAGSPYSVLRFSVDANFVDPLPTDALGNVYTVERSGFRIPAPAELPGRPFEYPAGGPGSVRWNGSSEADITLAAPLDTAFTGSDNTALGATWVVDAVRWANFDLTDTRFKLEATDRAANILETPRYNTIHVNWMYKTHAKIQNFGNFSETVPEIHWRLFRNVTELPGAAPACMPLALFRVYTVAGNNALTQVAQTTQWIQGPLRENTPMSTHPTLRDLLVSLQGQHVYISVIGADEAGNVQFDPAITSQQDLDDGGVSYVHWVHEQRDYQNTALDTDIRLNLFHERFGVGMFRDFGPASRVPLPPLSQACDTRVNSLVWFRSIVPAAASANSGVIWKLYKDGTIVARGLAPANWASPNGYDLMGRLLGCNPGFAPAALVDFDGSGAFIQEDRSVPRLKHLALRADMDYSVDPPVPCVVDDPDNFNWRLGDEGIPPDPANPNIATARRREIHYVLTAQAVVQDLATSNTWIDTTPATARFSVYVREVEEEVRDEIPVREFSR